MAWEDENDEVRDINDGWVMSMPCIRGMHGLCGVVWCSCTCHEDEEPDRADMARRDGRDAADLTKRGQNGL